VFGLQNVWVCAQDLQMIRADQIITLLVPLATGYGAASPDDRVSRSALCAEFAAATEGSTLTRVKIADCGVSPPQELLAGLAHALASAASDQTRTQARGLFIYADHDPSGRTRWITADDLPSQWPQSTRTTPLTGQVAND
jgi:hypothetical protein